MMRRAILAFVASAVLAPFALALQSQQSQQSQQQQQLPPRSTFRGRTDLIPVDVSVLDGDRRPVRGLTAADFTVLVDGKPRPVVAFSVVEVPGAERPAGTVASWVRDALHDVVSNDLPDEGRLVVVLMDGTIPNGQPTLAAKQIARAALDELAPGDLAAVVRSTIFGNNGLSQGFTGDRSRLVEAIESPFRGTTDPPEMTGSGLRSPSPVPGSALYTKEQCEVIFDIARAMRDAPRRRKVLLFVGSRINLGGELRFGGDIRSCRDEVLKELARSNITVQVVDPVGLLTTAVTADSTTHDRMSPNLVNDWARQNQQRVDALKVLPGLTGGRLVANTNTPEKYVPAIFAESQMYYLLGFEPASPGPAGAFHTIRVQVRRREATVHARSGYTAETAPTMSASKWSSKPGDVARAANDALSTLLDGTLPRSDLRLSIAVAPFAPPTGRDAAVVVTLGATLPPAPGARRLDIIVGAFDIRGRSVGVQTKSLELSAAVAARGDVSEGLVARLNLPPGRYELRAAVADELSGLTGTVFSFVDVPAFTHGRLTASGVLLHRAHPPVMPANPLADVVPFVPTVARAFQPTDDVRAFVRFYQSGAPQSLSVRARVVDAVGGSVFDRRTELGARTFIAGTGDFDLPLPLAELVPGDYLLRIETSIGEAIVERDVRFSVVR